MKKLKALFSKKEETNTEESNIIKIKQNSCSTLGFYQRNYFCEICQKIEPKVFQYCIKETKRKLETNEITQEQVEELLRNR